MNLMDKFSTEHRMPTLFSRISVSCFDILDLMSGRGAAIIFRKSGITELINLQREGLSVLSQNPGAAIDAGVIRRFRASIGG